MLRWPIPRLACVLPAPKSEEKSFEERDRSFEEWSSVLRKWCLDGKKKGKGIVKRELRLFFLCPQDMSLVECGPAGQGYEVSNLMKDWVVNTRSWVSHGISWFVAVMADASLKARVIPIALFVSAEKQPSRWSRRNSCSFFTLCLTGQVKELLNWAKKAKPLAKVGVALASIVLKVCTGMAIPTADCEGALGTVAGGALSDFVEETLSSGVDTMATVAGERLEGGRKVEHAATERPGAHKVNIGASDLLHARVVEIPLLADLPVRT